MQHQAPTIAVIGLLSWDQFLCVEAYPSPGGWAVVTSTSDSPGGTTGNIAVSAARLGGRVSVVSKVGDDVPGRCIRKALDAAGVRTTWVGVTATEPTDTTTVITSRQPPDRTFFCHKGATVRMGDRLDITAIFGHDIVIVDVEDIRLYRFLVDLPAHTMPQSHLMGTLTNLADANDPATMDIVLRLDTVVGNEREFLAITGTATLADAVNAIQNGMNGANLRTAYITRGALGAMAVTQLEEWHHPGYHLDAVDTTGAGDAFIGAAACFIAQRRPVPEVLAAANAVAALSITAVGAQSSLPDLAQLLEFLATTARRE